MTELLVFPNPQIPDMRGEAYDALHIVGVNLILDLTR